MKNLEHPTTQHIIDPAAASLERLASNDSVSASDVVAIARRLAPIDLRMGNERSVLRMALERDSHAFSLAQLEELAAAHVHGSDAAWADANRGRPGMGATELASWLANILDSRYGERVNADVALKIISLSSLKGLGTIVRGSSLGELLLAHSGREKFGLAPAVAWASAQGLNLFAMAAKSGRPAIFGAQSSDAFALFLENGQDPRAPLADGSPLWSAWREKLAMGSNTKLLSEILSWAEIHEKDAEERRRHQEYFTKLASATGGEDYLRKRADWATICGDQGQTPMMVLASMNPLFIKSFWEVKKALPGLATLDNSGCSIIHYYLTSDSAHRNPVSGVGSYLSKNAPIGLDARGQGIIPSTLGLSGRLSKNIFGFRFHDKEIALLCKKNNSARDWFHCEKEEDAISFSQWLIEKQSIEKQAYDSTWIASLSKLILLMDPLSFSTLHPRIAGGLAFTLAMVSDSVAGQDREACLAAILSGGASAQISADRRALLELRAAPKHLAMLDSVFLSADERSALESETPCPQGHKAEEAAPRSSMRI